MTSINLTVSGAVAQAETDGIITEGMTGLPVFIECDDEWEGLDKTLVCKSGAGQRCVLGVEDLAVVAPEVLQWEKWGENDLWLGLEGRTAEGDLVMVSTMAYCGRISPGANTRRQELREDRGMIWAQIKGMIGQLQNLLTGNKSDLVSSINEIADEVAQWRENGVNASVIKKALGYTPGKEIFIITCATPDSDGDFFVYQSAAEIGAAVKGNQPIYLYFDKQLWPATQVNILSSGESGEVRLKVFDEETSFTLCVEFSIAEDWTRGHLSDTPVCGMSINGKNYWPFSEETVVFDDAINAMIDAKLAALQNGS